MVVTLDAPISHLDASFPIVAALAFAIEKPVDGLMPFSFPGLSQQDLIQSRKFSLQ